MDAGSNFYSGIFLGKNLVLYFRPKMKPLMMHGHERSITQIKYNLDGDLLFSCAKDHHPNVWYSVNGERLGTYDGHCGAVWCLDPKWDNSHLVTGLIIYFKIFFK